jgi:hypothetical protein
MTEDTNLILEQLKIIRREIADLRTVVLQIACPRSPFRTV